MAAHDDKQPRLFGAAAHWAALVVCIGLGFALFTFVDLAPNVDDDFFFSTDDPQLQESLAIEQEFGSQGQVFVAAHAENLASRAYIMNVLRLTEALRAIDGVEDAQSLTSGIEKPEKVPDRKPAEIYEDLEDSAFFTQLILTPDRTATFVVLSLAQQGDTGAAIRAIDRVISEHEADDFRLSVSGVPYVSEHIRQELTDDLVVFSVAAFIVFGVLIGLLFRSFAILVGTMIAAVTASFGTFLVRALLGMETDILAPNLWTIAFVLTLSHVVYLAAQWKRQSNDVGPVEAARRSVRMTGPASAWSLVANLLGFATLVFVSAKPLRQFGISGGIAAVLAMVCAYLIFPAFLRSADPGDGKEGPLRKRMEGFFTRRHPWIAASAVIVALMLAPFMWQANTDPALPTYFEEDGRVGAGLRAIDRSAGSSPLDIVIADQNGGSLADDESYKRMRALHADLRDHPDVGSVLSMALLMRETDRRWYTFFLPWKAQLKQLDKEKNGSVGEAFIADDRESGLFILRMKELEREKERETVVSELEAKVSNHGFQPELTGGLYVLQGGLSKLVQDSVIRGLGGLMLLFFLIMLAVSRSLWTAVAMAFCLALTPLALFGAVGLFGMPLDIISAPAANVALPLGIDEMIHLGYRMRGNKDKAGGWERWRKALEELWAPILVAMLVVVAGFSLFLLSTFPPTQRLGILVCAGALITDLVVLIALPVVASLRLGRTKREKADLVRSAPSPAHHGG